MNDVIWTPAPEAVEGANVTRFMRRHGIRDVPELIRRSTADTSWFWAAALEDLGVRWTRPYSRVQDPSGGFPWTRWFIDGKLNLAANCIDPREPGRAALIGEYDDGSVRTWSYDDLKRSIARVANTLRSLGISKGDAVGIYMPMVPEIVAAFFGCLKIGAIAVPVFSAYGAPALASRLQDSGAKLLFTADGVSRRGKQSPLKPEADEAVRSCPSVQHVIVLPEIGPARFPWAPGTSGGTTPWTARPTRPRPPSWTPRTPRSSCTPRERRDGPRAASTPTPASSPSAPRSWPTPSTSRRATSSSGSRTSAG